MKIECFSHMAILVRNLEQSLIFYRDVLGLKELETVQTKDYSSTNLAIPGGSMLELIYYKEQNEGVQSTHGKLTVDHIAFDVVDVESHENELRKQNIPIENSCVELEVFNTRVLKLRDPNGVLIALRENIK